MLRSLLYLLVRRVIRLFRSDDRMAADAEFEIAVLHHEVAILRRQVMRPIYRASERAFLAAASRMLSREAWDAFLIRPETRRVQKCDRVPDQHGWVSVPHGWRTRGRA